MIPVVILPVAVPFVAALLLLARRSNRSWQTGVSIGSGLVSCGVALALLRRVLAGGVQVHAMGNWPAPFGIFFAADTLSAVMIAVSALVGLSSLLYACAAMDRTRLDGSFFALFQLLLVGINGAFLTGDLFNLFVFFEVVLMTSYVLVILGNERAQVRSGFPYLTINLIGSTLFLAGCGLLYAQLGTLNMAHIAERVHDIPNAGLVTVVAMAFFAVFGLKSAMFPMFNWLPDAYSSPPTPVSAVFAGLLTKVGVYSMYRCFGMIFSHDLAFTHGMVLAPLAGLTMLVGVWGAMVQTDIRYILAFHSISQVGYILMGLAIYTPLGIAAGIFHMVHHSLVKSSLFLLGGAVDLSGGSQDLKKLGGLAQVVPLAVLFLLSALSLAGIPPLSGFYSKLGLVAGGLKESHGLLVAAALVTSLFTLYSMVKIWRLGFWGTAHREPAKVSRGVMAACAFSVFVVVALGALANPVMKIAMRAADDLLDRAGYHRAVFSEQPRKQPGRWRADGRAEKRAE